MVPPGHFGPFWAFWGLFQAIWGSWTLWTLFETNVLPQGPATRIILPPNVEILAFLAVFVRFWQYFGQFLPLWVLLEPFGPFLGLLGPFWSLFDPLSLVVSSPWWQALEFEAI